MADPVAAGAGEHGRGDSILFEDDVPLDRGRGAVFLVFFDAIIIRCACFLVQATRLEWRGGPEIASIQGARPGRYCCSLHYPIWPKREEALFNIQYSLLGHIGHSSDAVRQIRCYGNVTVWGNDR